MRAAAMAAAEFASASVGPGGATASAPLDYGAAVVLGLVQGLTEFIPVSSKGHLVLAQSFLGVNPPGIALEIALHAGTLIAVCIYFRAQLIELAGAVPALVRALAARRLPEDANARLLLGLALGTLPAVIVAVIAKSAIEAAFESVRATLVFMAVVGVALQLTRIPRAARPAATLRDALIVGCAQAFAVLPGVSRSGTTIVAGVLAGLSRATAARFSFLLSIPAIVGALVFSLPDLVAQLGPGAAGAAAAAGVGVAGTAAVGAGVASPTPAGPLAAGIAVSFVSGYASLPFILFIAGKNRLNLFSYYLWTVSAVGLWLTR
jgi:undecaprenyl-diphosphatase